MKKIKRAVLSLYLLLLIILPSSAQHADFSELEPLKDKMEKFLKHRTPPAKSHWYLGGGILTSDIPIVKARLTLLMTELFYEYNIIGDLTGNFRIALGTGLYGLQGVFPVPVLQPSIYVGSERGNMMGRLSVGAFSDIVVGGHSGVLFNIGAIFRNKYDFAFAIVPFGTQPVKPYPEIFDRIREEFIPIQDSPYSVDVDNQPLIKYDSKHYHTNDLRYDSTSQQFYSTYDVAYGNGEWNNKLKAYPGDFDYIKPRDYINFPYYGFLITVRY